MNIKRIATVLGLAQAAWLSGCGGDDDGGSSSCGKVMPCGGDIVGDWKISTACLDTSSEEDFTDGVCPTATLTTSPRITGSVNYSANSTYTRSTTTSGTVKVTLPASCLSQGGLTFTCEQVQTLLGAELTQEGLEGTKCTSASGGCTCTASLASNTETETGTYTTSGSTVTHTASGSPLPDDSEYCVEGDTLHVISLDPNDDTKILSDIVAKR